MTERIISFNPEMAIKPDNVFEARNRTHAEVDNLKFLKTLGSILGKPIEITLGKNETDPKKQAKEQQRLTDLEAKRARHAKNTLLFRRNY